MLLAQASLLMVNAVFVFHRRMRIMRDQLSPSSQIGPKHPAACPGKGAAIWQPGVLQA